MNASIRIAQPMQAMETQHDAAGAALATLRQLTQCLENHILFPQAARLLRDRSGASDNGNRATAGA